MKSATELAEEFPIVVPNPYPIGSAEALEFKKAYRERFLEFIRMVQKDARNRKGKS